MTETAIQWGNFVVLCTNVPFSFKAKKPPSESKAKHRKIVQASIARVGKGFPVTVDRDKTVDDLKKLIEIDIELRKDEI